MLSGWLNKVCFHFQRYWSVRIRLTILYLAIFGSTLILFCSLLYRSFIINQQNEFDISLFNHAVDIAQGITVDPYGSLVINPDLLSMGGRIFPFPSGTVYIQILTLDGTELGRSRNLGSSRLPLPHKNLRLLPQSRAIFQTIQAQDMKIKPKAGHSSAFRLLTALSPGQSNRDFILQVAVPEEFLTQTTKDLERFLWIGIPLTLFAAALGGLYLSRRALAPVRDMIDRANRISPHHLSERVPIPIADDEIHSLALTLNDLLSRLQRAFESQERFIADASHEIKTPLAILRGELDVFRSRPRTPEEVSLFVENSLQEMTHLSRLVEDLLILARVDAGSAVVTKEPLQVEEIVFDVISKLEVLGRPKGVKIRFILGESNLTEGSSFSTQGDSDLLRILFKNLLENALKYSPPDQIVQVSLQEDLHWIYLEITDRGPGIPKEILPKIFERFYRGPIPDPSQAKGAGLGLAIVQKIAEVHGGKVEVRSVPGQETTFQVKIKKF
jgi:heavy metal sensor kinase